MPTFLFLVAICLLVAASILLETDASPPPKPNKNTKLEKGPSSAGNAESTPALQLTRENQWDSAARHKDLEFKDAKQLIVQHNGEEKRFRSVRAKLPIPNDGFFYYEVTILKVTDHGISIGLATEQMPVDEWVGESKGTYGYSNFGEFWGHKFDFNRKRRPLGGKPKFGEGNVVGCGVDLKSRQIIYTHNGVRLETAGLRVGAGELYPCISLYAPGTKIEANFGTKEFRFNIANGI
uniref:B30.2/SPRY domain-containing protein n=1 Tax=Globodera pallida TaxID=36090 RepID=A0A183BWT9_GLOPA